MLDDDKRTREHQHILAEIERRRQRHAPVEAPSPLSLAEAGPIDPLELWTRMERRALVEACAKLDDQGAAGLIVAIKLLLAELDLEDKRALLQSVAHELRAKRSQSPSTQTEKDHRHVRVALPEEPPPWTTMTETP